MQSDLLNALAAKGCGVETMLHDTFMDMEPFYEKMLRKLPENTAIVRLRGAFDAQDVNAAFEAAHELKGLYATLGLTPAYELCCAIVEVLRPRSGFGDIAEKLSALEAVHNELLAVIAGN